MAVAQLNEYAMRERVELRYEDVGSVGLDHSKTFTMRAVVNGKPYPDGVGKTKREAKLKAAEKALSVLSGKTIDPTESAAEASPAPAHQTGITQAKYTCWLNEYSHQRRVDMRAVETTRLGPTGATPCCRFVVGDKEYPAATGRTKKDAKEEAAKLVHQEICGSNTTEEKFSGASSQQKEDSNRNVSDICDKMKRLSVINKDDKLFLWSGRPDDGLSTPPSVDRRGTEERRQESHDAKSKRVQTASSDSAVFSNSSNPPEDQAADEKHNCTSGQQKEAINQNVSDICDKIRNRSGNSQLNKDNRRQSEVNFIGIVNHYCQRKNLCQSYIEARRCGPATKSQFFYKLMLDKKDYPEGEGRTVKEAKQNAARLAWSALQEQSDWDSKVSVKSTMSEDGSSSMLSARLTTQETHEVSSQSTPVDTGGSILSTDSSNLSTVQIPLRSTASGDDASNSSSTPTSLESLASSQSKSTGTSGSANFTDSSNSSRDQDAVKEQNVGKSQNEPSIPSRFTSDFDPLECLGRGAFGRVYKAKRKLQVEKYYAVKVVCCEEKSLREVGTLSELFHCNIVRYHTFWMEDSGYQGNYELTDSSAGSYSSSQASNNSSAKYLYIQMELCDTKTLKEWIKEKNNESLQDSKRREEGLSIAQQIVSGVEYIHSKKHIHRDLKPENILFGLDGDVKIGDFGLVTRDDDDDDDALMERTLQRGTTTYMAPEQKTEKNYDRKVDIFALGLIYFELLWKLSTGHERVAVWDDARSQKLPEEFSLTFPQENQIIESMLHEKPEDRPEAKKLKAEMEMCAQTLNAQNMHQEDATV